MSRGLVVLAAMVAVLPASAQQRPAARAATAPMMASVDTMLLRGLQYRMVGPNRGGRVTTVTGVPSQPRTFYMGVASGGVFRTTDGGQRWVPITDGKVPVGSMGSISVADSDPNVIYLGTGSDGLRSNVSTGRGVWKTTNGGDTWSFAGLYNAGQIGALRIHPRDPNTVWVAAVGDLFKANAERGIFKTTDGGRTWRHVLKISDTTGASDLEVHPADPNIVYAWMARAERKPWTIISGAREGGFYKSVDGGETWKKVATGLPSGLIGKGNLAVTAANPNRIYALIEALPDPGFYRSENAGETWAKIHPANQMLTRPFYYTTLGADPTNGNTVYAGAEPFFKSVDGGATWSSMPTPHIDNHDIWINPTDGNIMVQANDGGANVSTDGGRTWSTQSNQVTAEMYQVWLDNDYPYRLYGAQQDNSTLIIPMTPIPGQPEYRSDGPGCETGPIIPHPTNPDTVYGSCKGQYEWKNMRTGLSKQYWVGGQSLYGNDAKDLLWRFQRVSPMALSPHDPKVLYYGSQFVHRTRDAGVTWEKISPDLTANPACCQGASGEPITRDVTGEEFYSTLYAITESPHTPGVIWTGANDGPFHITRDNGRTWTNITPKDLPPGGRVAFIDASPHRPGSAYYAVYRYLLGDYAPYIYRTEDFGRTWTRLTDGRNGIPADHPTRVVREDPDRPGLLYAGTEFGMHVSFDNGAHWQSLQLNMPNVPINDIKVHRKDLVIATQGRSFWILDDLSPLHQITPATAQQSAALFRPRDAYRVRVAGGRGGGGGGGGRGAGRGNAAGPDPAAPQALPPGGIIEYFLGSVPANGVRIDIADSVGTPVAAFSSEGSVALTAGAAVAASPTNSDDPAIAAEMIGGGGGRGRGGAGAPAARLSKNIGMNKFYWDFVNQANTLPLPPGRYTVKLTAGSYVASHPYRLLTDPRLAADGVTAADLREQYLHNLRMRDMSAEVQRLQARLQAAQTRLATASGAAAADTLAKVRSVLSRVLDQPVRYGKPGVATHIRYLAGMTSGADQKVGRDNIARYQVLRRELNGLIAETESAIGK